MPFYNGCKKTGLIRSRDVAVRLVPVGAVMAWSSPFPEAPPTEPEYSATDRLWRRILPGPVRPEWTLHDLRAASLADYQSPINRSDVRLDWVSRPDELTPAHKAFLNSYLGLPARLRWMRYLRRKGAWIVWAWWRDAIRHLTLVQLGQGGGFVRFREILRPNSAYVGPAYTSPEARGQGIYPYVLASALERLRDHGYETAYISYRHTNDASRRGICKDPAWRSVARVLQRRRAGGLWFYCHSVTVLDRSLTAWADEDEAIAAVPAH